jgi:hypothetical protein
MIPNRRQFTGALVGAALAGTLSPARAQTAVRQPYLADMHSHYGMWLPRLFGFDLDRHMRENGMTLLAWAIVDDGAWIGSGPGGRLQQLSEPAPGAIWANWQRLMARYQGRLWRMSTRRWPASRTCCWHASPPISWKAASSGWPRRMRSGCGTCSWCTSSARRWATSRLPPRRMVA